MHSREHGLRGEVNGLLGGAALAVDGGAGDGLGEAGGELLHVLAELLAEIDKIQALQPNPAP